jgi:hypothetical protein
MLFSNFGEVSKRLARKPFPIPKMSRVVQELEGFLFSTALDLKWAITPLDCIKTHPKSVPLSFLGESILLQKVNDGYGMFSRHIPGKILGLM